MSLPFSGCPHTSLCDSFAVIEPSLVEVFSEVVEGFRDDPFGLLLVWMFWILDDIYPSIGIIECLREGYSHRKQKEVLDYNKNYCRRIIPLSASKNKI